MKIIMASSESLPFSKTGGLSDVVHSLSEELAKDPQNEVSIFTPLYKTIRRKEFKLKLFSSFDVQMGQNSFAVKVYLSNIKKVNYYLIENEGFFGRDELYGYDDDGERFALFCNAILKCMQINKMECDIMHLHDWQVGMIPCILKEKREFCGVFGPCKTVFTIHNPLFKGYFRADGLSYLYGLDEKLFYNGMVAFDGMVSTFKTALVYSDKITTVSPTHANELLTRESNFNIEGIMNQRKNDFVGILNGMDVREWDPKKDALIDYNFGVNDFKEGKEKNKIAFVKEHNLDEDKPIFSVVSRLTSQKGLDQIIIMANEIVNRGGIVAILGSGEKWAEEYFKNFARDHYKNAFVFIGYDNVLAHKVYASSDFMLMPSLFEPCGLTQIISQRYGTLPIVRKVGGLADTVLGFNPDIKNEKEANGIVFNDIDRNAALWSIDVAFNIYENSKIKDKIIRNAMKLDRSWKVSASKYLELYEEALKK